MASTLFLIHFQILFSFPRMDSCSDNIPTCFGVSYSPWKTCYKGTYRFSLSCDFMFYLTKRGIHGVFVG